MYMYKTRMYKKLLCSSLTLIKSQTIAHDDNPRRAHKQIAVTRHCRRHRGIYGTPRRHAVNNRSAGALR